MTDEEVNKAVAEARGHTTYTGHTDVGDIPARYADVCTDPAAWGGLLEWLAAEGYAPSVTGNRYGEWDVLVGDMHAVASSAGRALALAFLASKGIST